MVPHLRLARAVPLETTSIVLTRWRDFAHAGPAVLRSNLTIFHMGAAPYAASFTFGLSPARDAKRTSMSRLNCPILPRFPGKVP